MKEVSLRYDNIPACAVPASPSNGSACSVNVDLPNMKAPVYFYYKLDNFYQNHRRYVKSKNEDQLAGKFLTKYSQLSISFTVFVPPIEYA